MTAGKLIGITIGILVIIILIFVALTFFWGSQTAKDINEKISSVTVT